MNERDAIVPPLEAGDRLPWPQYFLRICFLVAERSTCLRRKVGAVAVRDKRILATGYNGAPTNVAHCLDVGCLREELGVPSGQRHEICRGLHAEQNVIIQAAVHGVSIKDSDIYCTTQPCLICSKMLANCGVRNIYFAESYPDDLAEDMLGQAGIRYERMQLETATEHDADERDAR
jgi:dCMP deaminase